MVHQMSAVGDKVAVKLEIEDSLEDEHGPFNKKQKQFPAPNQVAPRKTIFELTPAQYNPLEEPSPLGLRLRKSPSLLELIQMRLTEGGSSTLGSVPSDNLNSQGKGDTKGSAQSGATDKLKASNFPAALLRIGSWEYISRYEGDLVAKCYFAKHKLVWEILDGGLKSKIEIQWSDIMGLRADLPDDASATLVVVLARQPLFYRETNPQPRKHTLWQATTDFTDGQASLHRKHFLKIPHGLLNKHFEKLIQCDMRLNFLSQQPDITLDSPYFEKQPSVFNDLDVSKTHGLDQMDTNKRARMSIFEDIATPSVSQSSSITTKQEDALQGTSEIISREAPSPSSVMDTCAIEGSSSDKMKRTKSFEQLIMQGLRPSMSMTDLVNHIGNCISEQMSSENQTLEKEGSESRKILEDITQHLLGDVQFPPCSDEKSLMLRVNSLCSLLQKDGTPVQSFEIPEVKDAKTETHNHEFKDEIAHKDDTIASESGGGFKQGLGMSRIDSYGDLLLHLPRIASLPKFLFDISEDGDYQAR